MTDIKYAEVAVLGSVLLTNGDALDDLALTGDDFTDGRNGEMFDVMRSMRVEGVAVDTVTFVAELERRGTVDRLAGGAAALWSLTDQVPTAHNVGFYADIVHQSGVRRRVKEFGVRVAQSADGEGDLNAFMDWARTDLDAAFGMTERQVRFMTETLLTTVETMTDDVSQVPSPWRTLNASIGGFRPGGLYVFGARPGVGKTAIGLQVAMKLAERGTVAFCSLEMPERDLHLRAISQGADIPLTDLLHAKGMSTWHWSRIAQWRAQTPLQIAFDDRSGTSVFDVRSFARSVHRQRPLSGVVVDYLQLMTDKRDIPRHEKVADMSRQLKILARDLDVPVIALSQLNRSSEARSDKKPQLSDLRESGAIEQDADVVVLLHREMEAKDDASDELLMHVAKNRQGPGGVAAVRWEGRFVRAVDFGTARVFGQPEIGIEE